MANQQSPSQSTRIRQSRAAVAAARLSPRMSSELTTENQDSQHRRLLLGVARHSGLGDPQSCLTALAVLSASRALRRMLDRNLGAKENAESSFIALVTLYALEPIACTPEALALDAEITPSAMRKVLDTLERRAWVCRESQGPQGRYSRVHLTDTGIEITIGAVHRFLEVSAALAGELEPAQRSAAMKACAHLFRAAAEVQNEPAKSPFRP